MRTYWMFGELFCFRDFTIKKGASAPWRKRRYYYFRTWVWRANLMALWVEYKRPLAGKGSTNLLFLYTRDSKEIFFPR